MKLLAREIKATMGIYEGEPVHGILAEFPHPGALVHAAEEVRKAGYRHYDAYSPFPVHGLMRAMGLRNSKVGLLALGGGIAGFALAYWLQWWTSAVDYPINISGKPFFAVEPSIPIIFELTVLFSAFGAVVGMLALNGLPRPHNPLFYSRNFSRALDDAFFIMIAATDSRYDRERTEAFLRELGGFNIELITETEP